VVQLVYEAREGKLRASQYIDVLQKIITSCSEYDPIDKVEVDEKELVSVLKMIFFLSNKNDPIDRMFLELLLNYAGNLVKNQEIVETVLTSGFLHIMELLGLNFFFQIC
jgi:hypothetical protein